MKKILLITVCFYFLIFKNYAQNIPGKIQNPLIKVTADWCYVCGGVSWEVLDTLIQYRDTLGLLPIVIHTNSSKTPSLNISENYAKWIQDKLVKNVFDPSKRPLYFIGNVEVGSYNRVYTYVQQALIQKNKRLVGNVGVKQVVRNGKLEVQVTTKFFENSSGNHRVSLLVLENNITADQTNGDGKFESMKHKRVLRETSLDPNGIALEGNDFKAGQEVVKNFVVDVHTDWNSRNLVVVAILWKEDQVLNMNEGTASTGVENTPTPEQVVIYPNPAQNKIYVQSFLTQFDVDLFDVQGRKLSHYISPSALDISNLSKGVYYLKINDREGTMYSSTHEFIKQ